MILEIFQNIMTDLLLMLRGAATYGPILTCDLGDIPSWPELFVSAFGLFLANIGLISVKKKVFIVYFVYHYS